MFANIPISTGRKANGMMNRPPIHGARVATFLVWEAAVRWKPAWETRPFSMVGTNMKKIVSASIEKKSKYSGLYGDYSTFSDEMEEMNQMSEELAEELSEELSDSGDKEE